MTEGAIILECAKAIIDAWNHYAEGKSYLIGENWDDMTDDQQQLAIECALRVIEKYKVLKHLP